MCGAKPAENCDCGHDVGRLINTLSHQLKRQLPVPEEEDSTIAENTKEYLKARLAKEFPEAGYLSLPVLEL